MHSFTNDPSTIKLRFIYLKLILIWEIKEKGLMSAKKPKRVEPIATKRHNENAL